MSDEYFLSQLGKKHALRVTTVTICGDACPLSCASAEAYKLAQCTNALCVYTLDFVTALAASHCFFLKLTLSVRNNRNIAFRVH